MCGIVGYIGPKRGRAHPHRRAAAARVPRLRLGGRRGRAATAASRCGAAPGKLSNLEDVLASEPLDGDYGIGHTRWATHGRPTEENAHPHRDCTGQHRRRPQRHHRELPRAEAASCSAEGHTFSPRPTPRSSRTWSSASCKDGRPRGRGAAGAAASARPVRARADVARTSRTRSSPSATARRIVVGLGEGEYFVASDIPAILSHTRDVVFLEDGEMAVVTRDGRRRSPTSTASRVAAHAAAHHLGPDHGREGRLQALHAQGDPRAAARGRATPCSAASRSRRGDGLPRRDASSTEDELRSASSASRCSPAARRGTRRWSASS